MTAILVDQVSKRYGRGARAVDALRRVTLRVEPGEIYGLLGRNGAGKTTLVKVLLDLVRPSAGATSLLGVSSRDSAARRPVGYLPEDHRFPDYQTAAGAIGFYGALSGVSRARIRTLAPQLLETVKLSRAANQKLRSFSKGMKQRLGLAQALVHDPQVLFLDEPTDGVDPVGRAEIRDVLVDLKNQGKTIFLNSHLLSEVEKVCDRVGILDDGTLVREGTIAELTQTGLTYEARVDRPIDPATLDKLAALVGQLDRTEPTLLEFALGEEREVDAVVDLLRERDYGLRELTCKKRSLEQVFIDAVHSTADSPADSPAEGES